MIDTLVSHLDLLLTLLAVGAVGGFLSGLLGIGGGIIFVPALYFTLQAFSPLTEEVVRVAIATSMALVLILAASSTFWHNKKGAVDGALVKNWAPGLLVGVGIGTFFATTVDGSVLKQLFSVITLLIAVYMAFSRDAKPDEDRPHRLSASLQRAGAGLIAFIASLIGIGGAILTIPFMTYIGMPMKKAVGTAGALSCFIALPAMVGYIVSGLRHAGDLPPFCVGYVNVMALAVIVPVSMLLSPLGVSVSHRLPRNMLRRIFALVLIAVSIRMFTS